MGRRVPAAGREESSTGPHDGERRVLSPSTRAGYPQIVAGGANPYRGGTGLPTAMHPHELLSESRVMYDSPRSETDWRGSVYLAAGRRAGTRGPVAYLPTVRSRRERPYGSPAFGHHNARCHAREAFGVATLGVFHA